MAGCFARAVPGGVSVVAPGAGSHGSYRKRLVIAPKPPWKGSENALIITKATCRSSLTYRKTAVDKEKCREKEREREGGDINSIDGSMRCVATLWWDRIGKIEPNSQSIKVRIKRANKSSTHPTWQEGICDNPPAPDSLLLHLLLPLLLLLLLLLLLPPPPRPLLLLLLLRGPIDHNCQHNRCRDLATGDHHHHHH